MTPNRKSWLLWGVCMSLESVILISTFVHLVPRSVMRPFSLLADAFIAWLVFYQIRLAREAHTEARRRMAYLRRPENTPRDPRDDEEVRELRSFLKLLMGVDDLLFPLHVRGSNGGHYRLHFGKIANVQPMNASGAPFPLRLCAYVPVESANPYVGIYSTLIAQVLMLTTNEKGFHCVANGGFWV